MRTKRSCLVQYRAAMVKGIQTMKDRLPNALSLHTDQQRFDPIAALGDGSARTASVASDRQSQGTPASFGTRMVSDDDEIFSGTYSKRCFANPTTGRVWKTGEF